MKVDSAKLKYKSSMNLLFAVFLGLFQIVVLLLLTSPIFAESRLGLRWGILLAVLDAAIFLPMLFLVHYEIRSDCLYISDYPFGFYKIPYDDILAIGEEVSKKEKHVKKVGLSTKYMTITYRKLKKGAYETHYMLISPADAESFLIFLKSKTKLEEKKEAEKSDGEKKTEKIEKEEKISLPKKAKKQEKALLLKAEKPKKQTMKKQEKETEKEVEKAPEKDAEVSEIVEQPKNDAAFFTVEDDEEKPL